MSYRSWIFRATFLLLTFAGLSGCATTVVGALRAPVSDCTSHCRYLTDDDARYGCLLSCPGARYSAAACTEAEPASVACANDRREDTQANAETERAVFGLIGLALDIASDVQSSSCHDHHRH